MKTKFLFTIALAAMVFTLCQTDEICVLYAKSNDKLYDIKWNIANQNSLMITIVNKLDKSGDFDIYTMENATVVHVTAVFAPAAGIYLAGVTGGCTCSYSGSDRHC